MADRKRVLERCFLRGLLALALFLLATPATAETAFYVVPSGNDAWSGRLPQSNSQNTDGPFASLERARAAVAALKKSGPPSGAVTVWLRGGVYHLAKTFTLTASDGGSPTAPVVYQAYRNEKPTLCGGLPIRNFTPHSGKTLKADVKAHGLGGAAFKQLFFDGRRQELARYPNVDAKNPLTSGWTFTDHQRAKTETPKRTLRQSAADTRSWAQPADGEICVFPSHEWWNNIAPITAVDPAERLITLARDCSYPIEPGDRYFVRGLLEELDAPGEWQLDKASGTLYFWPPAPLDGRPVYAPRLRTLVEIGLSTAYVTLRGLTFECCEGNAVALDRANHCQVAGCTIRNVGDYNGSGVAIIGGMHNGVVGCDISDTGSHGVSLSGGLEKTLMAGGNYAENNHITRTGVFYKQGCGVNVSGVGNRVARNELHHLPRFGVMATGQNHVIELNHIHHVSLETMDTAAIYLMSLNWLSGHGCIVRHNFIHDVIGRSGKAGKWRAPYFAWGVYLDWTAMGMTVSGNIVARTPRAGIHVHDGRDNLIENNIIVDCGAGRSEHGPTSQIEFNGWDTTYGYWTREIANWSRQFDSVAKAPAWQKVATLHDPRTVALPDRRTMQRNVVRRHILSWGDPQAQAFQFRNVPFEHNLSDMNLIWHHGAPPKTGQFKLKAVSGPNIAPPNAGFEQGAADKLPDRWTWHIRPSAGDTATLVKQSPHGGQACLRISGRPDPANKDKESWARIPSVKSAEVPLRGGHVYCLAVWLRAERPNTRVEIGLQAYRANLYTWQTVQTVAVGPEWSRYELIARFPAQPPEMKSCYVRVRLPDGEGTAYVDDVELRAAEPLDEWSAWQALGMDRHSLIADPRFVDAAKDDYRLRADSPAFKLGFQPIPVEKIGCYRDELRASWPIAGKEQAP